MYRKQLFFKQDISFVGFADIKTSFYLALPIREGKDKNTYFPHVCIALNLEP